MKKAILYQNKECVKIKNVNIANNVYAFFVQVNDKKIIYLKENYVRGNVNYASLDKLVNLFPQYQTPGIFNAKVMLDTFTNTINYKIRTGTLTESEEILEIISQFQKIINDPYIKQKTSTNETNIFSHEAMQEVTDTIKKLDVKYKKVSLSNLLHSSEESVNDVFLSQNWLDNNVIDNKTLVYKSIAKSNKAHKRSPIDFLFNNKVLNMHMIIIIIAAVGFASCLELLSSWKKSGGDVTTEIDELREEALVDDPNNYDEELPNDDVIDPTENQVETSNNNVSNKTSNKTSNGNNNQSNTCTSRWGAKYCEFSGIKMLNVNFDKLKKRNGDTAGWIFVNNTQVNYPIVQTKDNEYYLTHDFDKNHNAAGWIFADYRSDMVNFAKKNTVIYGHGRTDQVMFGSLDKTLDSSWYKNKNNQIIKISTPTRDTLWQIVSIYVIKQESYYLSVNFENDKSYQKWIDTMLKRSKYDFKYKPTTNDKFLTLSTCYDWNGNRTVVQAVLVKNVKK